MNETLLTQLDPIDRQILQAFLSALSQLNDPLPPSLVTQLNQIGNDLQHNCLDSVPTLEEIAHQYNPLTELYEQTCIKLQAAYEPQELVRPTTDENFQDHPINRKQIENITITSFTSSDPVQEIKKNKNYLTRWLNSLLKKDDER
ncbi:MAG: hypothetical protein AAGA60_23765 [Cyanobacteria bacterium P01_E01_bin.42]